MNVKPIPQASEMQLIYKTKVKASDRPKVTKSEDVYQLLKAHYDDNLIELREEFMVLLLNRANCVLGHIPISTGVTSGALVDVKFIVSAACLANSTSVIISHNHPSGNKKPSDADLNLTQKIKKALNLVDVCLLDHIIVTKEGYFSLGDEGYL